MSAPHPTAIDTADPIPVRDFKPYAPKNYDTAFGQVLTALADCDVDLEEVEKELNRNRLAEIAAWVQKLTYGEMIELAAALWRNRPDDAPVTQEALPGILHRWSSKP